ncbi:hypothetical protein KR009_001165 [Drosophila setifemur]|nr:hypothetical protein KR009_001165 [Drosophila setifemur]
MWKHQLMVWQILILLKIVRYSEQRNYAFEIQDENVFTDCQNGPPGYVSFDKMIRSGGAGVFSMDEAGAKVTGNMTVVWDVQKTDRIEVRYTRMELQSIIYIFAMQNNLQTSSSVYHFDRGEWKSIGLTMMYKDFCAAAFDTKQFWYTLFGKFIVNDVYAKENCLTFGMVFVMEPHSVNLEFGLDIPIRPGRYKILILFRAIDEYGEVRPDKICTEIKADYY